MQMQQTEEQSSANSPIPFFNHPRGLYILSFAEMFERFSYYGMRSLLLLYMVGQLKYADDRAYSIYGIYATLVYASPIIGGYLADKVIGFQRAIILGSLVIASGHLCMALDLGEPFFYAGLGLIISGTGLFKSNVSAMVGMLYGKTDQRRDAGYTLFYLGINIGGFFAPLICGFIGTTYGWHFGFGLASFGMILGASVLMTQRHHFAHIEQPLNSKTNLSTWTMVGGLLAGPFFAGMIYANDIFRGILPFVGMAFLIYLLRAAYMSTAEERRNILALVVAIFLLLLSGALVEQTGMALTLFIERNVDRAIFGWTIPTSFFHSIDPLTVLIFGGFFSWLWMRLASKGRDLQASTKYIIAFSLMGLAYLIIFLGCKLGVQPAGTIPLLYAFAAMVALSMGDICIYPVTLSLCSRLSPQRLQGVLMGGVMMGVAFSQLLGSVLAKMASLPSDKLEQSVDLIASVSLYRELFQTMTLIAVACIALTIFIGLWMNKVTRSDLPQIPA